MSSLKTEFLENLTFTTEQISTLRALGEYRGKQALFFKQSPEALKSLQLVAKIESSESSNRLEGIELPHKKNRRTGFKRYRAQKPFRTRNCWL